MKHHVKVVAEERTGGTSYDFHLDGEYVGYYSGIQRTLHSCRLRASRLTSGPPYIIQYRTPDDKMVAWSDSVKFFPCSPSSPDTTLAKYVDMAIRGRLSQTVTHCCAIGEAASKLEIA